MAAGGAGAGGSKASASTLYSSRVKYAPVQAQSNKAEKRRELEGDLVNRSAVENKLPSIRISSKATAEHAAAAHSTSVFSAAGENQQKVLGKIRADREGASRRIRTGGFQKISTRNFV